MEFLNGHQTKRYTVLSVEAPLFTVNNFTTLPIIIQITFPNVSLDTYQKAVNAVKSTFAAFALEHCLYVILCTFLQIQFQQRFERVLGNTALLGCCIKSCISLPLYIRIFLTLPLKGKNNKKGDHKSSHRTY